MKTGPRIWIAAAMVAAGFYSPAAAQSETTGNDLHEYCQGKTGFRLGLCTGYISGLWHGDFRRFICSPQGATNEQAMDIVVQYLRRHPENRQQPAAVQIVIALSEAWPCPEPAGGRHK